MQNSAIATTSRVGILASLSWSRLGLASALPSAFSFSSFSSSSSSSSSPPPSVQARLFEVLFRDDGSVLKNEAFGFSTRSLDLAADELGLSRAVAGAIRPAELVHEFNRLKLVELKERLAGLGEPETMHEGLVRGVGERLAILEGYRATWAGAMAALADVHELQPTLDHVEKLTSAVLRYAGDLPAVDMSWYSKRLLLGGILGAAEVQLASGDGEVEEIVDWADRSLRKVLV